MRRVMGIGLGLFLASVLLLPVSCGLGGGRSSKQWIPPPPPVSVGKAFLGPLVGATVEIYEVEANGVFTLQFTETTSDATELRDAGSFPSHATELTRTSLYLFKVTGGVDVDADYDTVRDPVPTPNQGSIHALVTGEQVKAGTFWVTALTEVAYRGVRYMMLAGYPPEQIGEAFDEFAPLLIAEDATGDGVVDREDLHQWASYDDLDRLRKDVTYYEDLVDAIRANDEDEIQRYAPHLADASVAFLDELDPRHLVVEGTYAYVAEDELGLAIVDVSDPAFPEVVSILDTPGDAEGVAVLGTLAYIADDTGLQIVDITDPTNPVLRGRTTEDFDVARAVTASGTHAFVAARANGLFIMDVTDPDAPYVVWERHEDEWLDQVFLQGDLLYVAAGWGIFILDVTNPSDPVYVGDYEVEGDADVVIVEGGLAYVGASDEQGLLILDVSNPGDPQYVASVESPGDVEGL
ncbi:MAG: LVIVD repeat-containing protein, partial [Planctomycetota bacterium]